MDILTLSKATALLTALFCGAAHAQSVIAPVLVGVAVPSMQGGTGVQYQWGGNVALTGMNAAAAVTVAPAISITDPGLSTYVPRPVAPGTLGGVTWSGWGGNGFSYVSAIANPGGQATNFGIATQGPLGNAVGYGLRTVNPVGSSSAVVTSTSTTSATTFNGGASLTNAWGALAALGGGSLTSVGLSYAAGLTGNAGGAGAITGTVSAGSTLTSAPTGMLSTGPMLTRGGYYYGGPVSLW